MQIDPFLNLNPINSLSDLSQIMIHDPKRVKNEPIS